MLDEVFLERRDFCSQPSGNLNVNYLVTMSRLYYQFFNTTFYFLFLYARVQSYFFNFYIICLDVHQKKGFLL